MNDDRFEPKHSIGEASKKLGIIVPVLRMLEKSNLVLTARDEFGKRLYSQCDLDYIGSIIDLAKKNGKSVQDIQQSISGLKCWEILECPTVNRDSCSKYKNYQEPCWMKRSDFCEESHDNCRDCQLYRSLADLLSL